MEPSFTIGPVSIGAAKVLAIGVGAYAIATITHAVRAYTEDLEDKGSAMLASLVMTALAFVMWVDGARLVPAPFSLAILAIYMAGVLITLTYTLSNAAKRLEQWRTAMRETVDKVKEKLPDEQRAAWESAEERLRLTEEEKRKTPHLMMAFFFVIYGVLGWSVLRAIRAAAPADANFARESWGNLQTVLDAGILASGHMVGIICLMGLLFLLLPVEMVRLRFPELDYPFKHTINNLLREKEAGLFGAHYYITATLPLAVLWLARDPAHWDRTLYAVLAVFCVTVFADAMSALVGIRYGKRKWWHNPNKSLIGTFGGTIAAFALALPLVGVPVAIASALVFYLVDVLAPVPFSASDNILNPLALAICYTLMEPYLAPMLPYY